MKDKFGVSNCRWPVGLSENPLTFPKLKHEQMMAKWALVKGLKLKTATI